MNYGNGRLINVSNRLPVAIKKHAGGPRVERSSGGLASALDSAWRQHSGVWIGWAGTTEDQEVDGLLNKASRKRSYTLQSVSLSEEEIAKFYSGFANEIIWPLFHDMQSRCNFDPAYWEIYQNVNRKFAKAVANIAREEDFVWVHDYHLMMMGLYLRQLGVRSRVGFFLHIPFPSPDMFEKLPWREPILKALLQFDIVGFQTDRDRQNFVGGVERLIPGAHIEKRQNQNFISLDNHIATAGTFGIGIDFEEFSEHANRPEVATRASQIRRDLNEKTLVLGVDRLDYTKGVPERLKAFRLLLQRFPELRGQITLVQVVVPSREDIPRYKDLRSDLEHLVSRINGEFTQPGWVPIHYMHRNLGRDELLAYYRAADIALITPLRDGMNLVAKEFCAAQSDERGVLIVSEFAGASQDLRHGAILVNPNDFAGVAQAIYDATKMSPEEKRTRMRLLREIVRDHNVQRWARSFLQAAGAFSDSVGKANGGNGHRNGKQKGNNPPDTPGVALVASPVLRNRYGRGTHQQAV